MQPHVIFLMGPTASGKTDLALSLAEHLPCELISVDSALIYREMNIGTAKPGPEILERYPHRLVDILDPTESYSVGKFYDDVMGEIRSILDCGRIPLLVGGTMLYFKALRDGIANLPEPDPAIREEILALAERDGWPTVHQLLAEVDPESAARINQNDPQRIQRALEVFKVSGRSMGDLWREQANKQNTPDHERLFPPLDVPSVHLAVSPQQRSDLHLAIERRFDAMLASGFEQEVLALRERWALSLEQPSMRCVGYRQMWQYLDGELTQGEMRERGIIATRQLAKRQLTWLRQWPSVNWFETEDTNKLSKVLKTVELAVS